MSEPITTSVPDPAPATEAVAVEEPKTCAQCGEPAVYTSPADNVMDEASFCARHKPVNAPKK